ncbi:MAG: reverse gyrase, partial [Nanoarchaeota archaeon]
LLFVSQDYGKEKVYELKEFLNNKGINALTYEELDEEAIQKFVNKEIKVLIGIASYRNPLARGIDLPEAIKYAVFYGVPKFIFNAKIENNPRVLIAVLMNLNKVLPEEIKKELDFERKLTTYLYLLKKMSNYNKEYLEQNEYFSQKLKEIQDFIANLIEKEEIKKILKENPDISFDGENFIIADVAAYLQASGRTSRLYVKGLSKGLSIVMVDNKKAFNNLQKRIKWFFDDLEFKRFEELGLEKIIKEIEEERELIKKIKEGKIKEEIKQLVKTTLIIVESPNKARTIAHFFGEPTRRIVNGLNVYEVSLGNEILMITASQGHILDLIKKEGYFGTLKENEKFYPVYTTIKRCLFNNEIKQITDDFEFCEVLQLDKIEFIKALQKTALEVDEVLIATDPDNEGEKIGYDLYILLKPYNSNIKRIEYHEVTRKAILEAIKNKRDIKINMIKEQILRRVADRWVGFALSLKLQKDFNNKNYSAGRVQTPVLGWVIKRDEEAKEKKALIIAELVREFNEEIINKLKEEGTYLSNTIFIEEENKEKVRKIKNAKEVVIEILERKEEELKPLPPYTTDALLKDANEKLKFSAQKTMQLAQNLFELGICTYHRTDSTHISTKGIEIAKEYLKEKKLDNYFVPRKWGEEGAHEAIRPTRAYDAEDLKML